MSIILWVLAGIGFPVLLLIYAQYLRSKTSVTVEGVQSIESRSLDQGILVNWASRKGLNTNIIWIIVYTVLSIAAYSVLCFHDYFSTDFSYLALPIIVPLQILIAGRLARMFLPVSLNKYHYHLVNIAVIGTSISLFVFLLFNRSPQFIDNFTYYLSESSPSTLQTTHNIINEIAGTRLYLFLLTITIVAYKALPFNYITSSKLRRFKDVALAACITLIGYSLFSALNSFVFVWEPIAGVSWIILIGSIAVAISILAGYSANIQDAFISEISLWFSSSKLRMFLIGSVLCSYIVFLRPFTFSKVEWAVSVIEWGLACFVIWRIYNGIQGKITEEYTIRLKYSSWKKHMHRVERKIDDDFSYAVSIQNDFVEHNDKDPLLVYLVTLMHDNGVSVDDIGELVHPLTEYRHKKIPLFSSSQKRNKVKTRNREDREQITNSIMAALEEREINMNRQSNNRGRY